MNLLTSITARDLIRKEDFHRLMFHASLNGSLVAKPLWGLVEELTLDHNGMKRLHEEKQLVFGGQGERTSKPSTNSLTSQPVLTRHCV